jgi:hypothetical protein
MRDVILETAGTLANVSKNIFADPIGKWRLPLVCAFSMLRNRHNRNDGRDAARHCLDMSVPAVPPPDPVVEITQHGRKNDRLRLAREILWSPPASTSLPPVATH